MPLFLKPGLRFPIVLDIDKDDPAETRPTFFAMSLSMDDASSLTSLIDSSIEDSKDADEVYEKTIAMILQYVTGWKNMNDLEFNETNLRKLAFLEARELLRKVGSNQHVQPEEKKS